MSKPWGRFFQILCASQKVQTLRSILIKPSQNKKGQKIFQLHRFLNTFLQQAAEKKYSKNSAAGNFFGPSYFVTALVPTCLWKETCTDVHCISSTLNHSHCTLVKQQQQNGHYHLECGGHFPMGHFLLEKVNNYAARWVFPLVCISNYLSILPFGSNFF